MKRLAQLCLLLGLTLMGLACSGSVNPDAASTTSAGEAIQGPGNTEGAVSEGESAENSDSQAPANFDRLRLPNMEDLPSDKELATHKPDEPKGGGGVIARPPSE